MAKSNARIVLVMNHPERERRTMEKIKAAIERVHPAAEVHIIVWRDPCFMKKVLEVGPYVIMTFPFTARTASYTFYILKYLLNCLLVCFPTEGILPVESPEHIKRMLGMEEYGINFVDHEIFWGPYTAELAGNELLERGRISSIERIHQFGWPSFEDYFKPAHEYDKILPNYLVTELNKYPRNKILLFVTGFCFADYSPQDLIKAGDLVDTKSETAQKDFDEMLLTVQKTGRYRQMWVDAIIKSNRENPGLLFVVKIHPLESIVYKAKDIDPYAVFGDFENIVLVTETIPFRAIIPHCSLLFHYGSTTLLEAYLAQVPSVYVDSKELRDDSTKFNPFSDFAAPSTLTVDVVEVPSVISRHSSGGGIEFERNSKTEQFLERQLGLKIGHEYNPSDKIARFLLSLVGQEPQLISSDDKYLINSVRTRGGGIIASLIDKALEKIKGCHFREAVTLYLDKALTIAQIGGIQVPKLQYLRSVCLCKVGLLEESLVAIEAELAINPDDCESQKVHRILQSELGKNKSDACDNIQQHAPERKFGRRQILQYDLSDGQAGLEYARDCFKKGNFNESFDVYEQLSIAYPDSATEILAEVYDQYQRLGSRDRYTLYQSRFYEFGIRPGDKVLDIGSVHEPFPFATHLADITVEDDSYDRAGEPFKYVDGKPVFECSVEKLPFGDKEFDFVYCSHVLEHVANPEQACRELMRVGKRGFIETPTRSKDIWLNTNKAANHLMVVEKFGQKLMFTEYTPEEIEGFGNNVLFNMHLSPETNRERAFSALLYLKAHLINTMLLWEDSFEYEVRKQDRKTVLV